MRKLKKGDRAYLRWPGHFCDGAVGVVRDMADPGATEEPSAWVWFEEENGEVLVRLSRLEPLPHRQGSRAKSKVKGGEVMSKTYCRCGHPSCFGPSDACHQCDGPADACG